MMTTILRSSVRVGTTLGFGATLTAFSHRVPIGNVQNPSKTPNCNHFGIEPQLGMSKTLTNLLLRK
jgi:hypothetical protein